MGSTRRSRARGARLRGADARFSGRGGGAASISGDAPYLPPEALKAAHSGQVVVQFVVDEQGHTRDVEAVRTSDPVFDTAARHVVMVMPWWKPGAEHGQPVRVRCTLPIIFTFRRNP